MSSERETIAFLLKSLSSIVQQARSADGRHGLQGADPYFRLGYIQAEAEHAIETAESWHQQPLREERI